MCAAAQILRASIVIAAFDSEATIARAIASAQAQTEPNMEIIVVDDASRDRTANIVARLRAVDRRIAYLAHTTNQGPAAARNTAFRCAKGRWLAILDADDAMHPTRIATLCSIAEQHRADLIADNQLIVSTDSGTPGGYAFPHSYMDKGSVTLHDLLRNDQPGTHAGLEFGFAKPVIRREFLSATGILYPEDIRVGEDFLFYAECLLHGARFTTNPEALYHRYARSNRHAPGPRSLSESRIAADHMSRANRRLAALIESKPDQNEPDLIRLVSSRQHLIDITRLAHAIRHGHGLSAMIIAQDLPLRRLLGHAGRVLHRRLTQAGQ